jgi:hypothetical protein
MEIWLHLDQLPTMAAWIKGRTGIRSRLGQSKIIAGKKLGTSWRKGLVSGSEVVRHAITWAGSWLNVDPNILFAGGFDAEVIGNTKLLVRQTGERIVAAVDSDGLYHLNNVHSFSLTNPDRVNRLLQESLEGIADAEILPANYLWLQYLWLDGLMNSTLWLYLYQMKSREAGRALAQIDIEMVEAMPAPLSDWKAMSAIALLVNRIRQSNDGYNLCRHERYIDRLVYDLYGLTEAQVKHIETMCTTKLKGKDSLPDAREALAYAESLKNGDEAKPLCVSS